MKLTIKTVSPNDMLLFADVVKLGNYTKAAMHHGISKQAVSARIKHLESTIGVRLLHRTTRSLKPTEAGSRYFAQCLNISNLILTANEDMQSEQIEPQGTLVISAPVLFGRSALIEVLFQYRMRYPKVRIDLKLSNQLVNLIDDGIDVALRVGHLENSDLSARLLGSVRSLYVASPQLREQYARLNDTDFLKHAPALISRHAETWKLPSQTIAFTPNTVLICNDLTSLNDAVLRGLGVARIPELLCADLIKNGQLVILLSKQTANQFDVFAAYANKRQLAPKIRAFIDLLIERKSSFTEF